MAGCGRLFGDSHRPGRESLGDYERLFGEILRNSGDRFRELGEREPLAKSERESEGNYERDYETLFRGALKDSGGTLTADSLERGSPMSGCGRF